MKYYIIAGEASGDMHGANLIHSLKESDPEAEFRYWGGDKMEAEAGTPPTKHYRETAIMGIIEVLKKYRTIKGFFKLCKADILSWQPDAIIFIDYPGFNLKIAKWAKGRGFKTLYYIAPKVWAWRQWRVKTIAKYIDRLYAIFPFEREWFASHGVDAIYVGNPLLDEITERELHSSEAKPERPIIALVAGSRVMEVEHNLPVMVEVMKNFEGYDGVVTGVDWLDKSLYEKILEGSTNVRVVYGKTYETMRVASGALVTSGTATLEAALLGVPQVVCYRGPALTMSIARLMLQGRIHWVSLVNIIMNRTVVTELLGNKAFNAQSGTDSLRSILEDGKDRKALLESYTELREILGETGASSRCATEIVSYLTEK
ncbi:MAG: lipid-A-disaccharide synthase [Rikenellaceae bacterium]